MMCKNYLGGHCAYGNKCKFSHDFTKKYSKPCRFFKQGLPCAFGAKCKFLHDKTKIIKPTCFFSLLNDRCTFLACMKTHHDIQILTSKMKWKCYVPVSFQIIHTETIIHCAVWTQDAQTFFVDRELTKIIPPCDTLCRKYPMVNAGITHLIDEFRKRDFYLTSLYELLTSLPKFLPKTVIFLMIDEYLSDAPKDDIHYIQSCGN